MNDTQSQMKAIKRIMKTMRDSGATSDQITTQIANAAEALRHQACKPGEMPKKGEKGESRQMSECCRDCSFWTRHSDLWGRCSKALNGTWFTNHTSRGEYKCRHTNARYHGQRACKVRFERREEA